MVQQSKQNNKRLIEVSEDGIYAISKDNDKGGNKVRDIVKDICQQVGL